jgi:SET domain-containing protein
MCAIALYIKSTKEKGRGVYCKHPIRKDEIIEECPMLIIPGDEHVRLESTKLADYFFCFNKIENTKALALGFGSLYNHRCMANAHYWIDDEKKCITFYALEDIPKHAEICINYGGNPGADFTEWFTARNITYYDSSH